MNRRQFGATVASTTLALAGVSASSTTALAQDAESERVENVSATLGTATLSADSAAMTREGDAAVLRARGGRIETETRTLSADGVRVTVEQVDDESYRVLREGFADATSEGSATDLFAALGRADVPEDASAKIELSSLAADGRPLADEVAAGGTVGGIVPDGAVDLAAGESVSGLGATEFRTVRVARGETTLTAEDVIARGKDGALEVTAATGEVTAKSKSASFEELTMTVEPPTSTARTNTFEELAAQAEDGSLSLSSASEALSDVRLGDLLKTAEDAAVRVHFAKVSKGGYAVEDVTFTGTMTGLLAKLARKL